MRNSNEKALQVIILISLILLSQSFQRAIAAPSTQPPSIPSGVVATVPIIITNSQATPAPAPFQEMIMVDSDNYSEYEAANLQNVEFFYGNGTLIPSWLESGNTNSTSSTIYWLNIEGGIPANSNLTIYMGFGRLTTNFFNRAITGEAPQLSQAYGQYDDGDRVFQFYDDFQQSALSSAWITDLRTGSYSLSDGLTISSGFGYIATISSYSDGYTFDAYVSSIGDMDNIGFFDLGAPLNQSSGAFEGAFIRTACGTTYPDQWNSSEANGCGTVYGSLIPGQEGASGIYSVSLLPSYSSAQSFNYASGNSTQPISTDGPGYPLSAGFVIGNNNPVSVQWARVRATPPNEIMPSAMSGNVTRVTSYLYPEYVAVVALVVGAALAVVYLLRSRRDRQPRLESYLQ